jgi:hypothetical protein
MVFGEKAHARALFVWVNAEGSVDRHGVYWVLPVALTIDCAGIQIAQHFVMTCSLSEWKREGKS